MENVGVHKSWLEVGQGVKGTFLNCAPMKSFTRQAKCLDQISNTTPSSSKTEN